MAGVRAPRVERIDDLLTEDERQQLRGDLTELARLRARVEVEGRCLPMS